ncbi:MAG: endolytic transglycosylase MltG [Patescibacteria group bacterium]|nr:endolytic transglycosylase MltG [Patescibacteria group bacterium]
MFNLNNYNPRNSKILLKNFFIGSFRKVATFLNYIKISVLRKLPKIKLRTNLTAFSVVSLSFLYFSLILSPGDFPVGSIIRVEEGMTLNEVAAVLEEKHVIKSASVFSGLAKVLMNDRSVMAGDYFFEERCSVVKVLWRTTSAIYGITPTKIMFVEGLTIFDMANLLNDKFPEFDKEEFIEVAQAEEGFLFPDTYYFLPTVTPEAVITTMKENFYNKIEEISEQIEASGMDIKDIVIMASILEKEARTLKSKRVIAGILWKRIEIGMPLQVDAVFPYIIGKNTYQLSLEDLKVESPYNTYTNKGLPIGPIANPSLWSLLATVTPVGSDYLFYLSDDYGNMHYAVDFDQHKSNKRQYLY